MIYLGLDATEKDLAVQRYCAEQEIRKVFILSPRKFFFTCTAPDSETIEYADIIEYRYFYRILQEIDSRTLVVVNECLRTQNRYDLTYNCIRNFLNQTTHQLIFQYLPLIDEPEDFMILFDFDTRSRWKRVHLSAAPLAESRVEIKPVTLSFQPVAVDTSNQLKAKYAQEKERLIAGIGLKDPHTIPRNLYLLSGKAKLGQVDPAQYYIGRNNRFKLANLQTYKEGDYAHAPYTVFEFCHNYIDFADFLSLSRQVGFAVLTADLKVDRWYLARYQAWAQRIADAYSIIQGK